MNRIYLTEFKKYEHHFRGKTSRMDSAQKTFKKQMVDMQILLYI